MTNILLVILIILAIVILVLQFVSKNGNSNDRLEKKTDDLTKEIRQINYHIGERIDDFNKNIGDKQEIIRRTVASSLMQQEERFKTFSVENSQHLNQIRTSVRDSLIAIQNDNNKKLDEMRVIVDEKLQNTINTRMNESFKFVSDRLEQVYKGLGEMQSLAQGVGDLKKVLSNVKTRGILGEIQLESILKEVMSPEQYSKNVTVKENSREQVEFAIKFPSDDGTFVYLPIDSKFAGNTYHALQDAYELGDKKAIEDCGKTLERVINDEAKEITKYINPPITTNFAIMFLPFEGLYAEVVNRGLVEQLQNKYKVNVAGPSTMAALLNSLQMGFNTLAIRKRSVEIETVLQAVKTEFDNFEKVLVATQKKLDNAHDDLDKLIGVRTKKIKSKLKNVSKLEDLSQARDILEVEDYEE